MRLLSPDKVPPPVAPVKAGPPTNLSADISPQPPSAQHMDTARRERSASGVSSDERAPSAEQASSGYMFVNSNVGATYAVEQHATGQYTPAIYAHQLERELSESCAFGYA
jgi:hypothetical protein